MRSTERLLTQIYYKEEVKEAEDSGYEFLRATTAQLQNALDALTRQNFEQTKTYEEEMVEWEEELEVEEMLLPCLQNNYTTIVPISGRGGVCNVGNVINTFYSVITMFSCKTNEFIDNLSIFV